MLGTLLAMPIVVLNMGGEMVYILHQRLQAQEVSEEKGRKVLEDVIKTMYAPLFLEELFKPQEMYSAASTKQIFEKLAHSSIMRLNKSSMDKLYDLMSMGVKYQLIASKTPHQYLQITINHLESMIALISDPEVIRSVQDTLAKAVAMYTNLSHGNWMLLEQSLLQFFQGKKIRVSLFLQHNLQNMSGDILLNNDGYLPLGTDIPGEIRYFENKHCVRSDRFPNVKGRECLETDNFLDLTSPLGLNMYQKKDPLLGGGCAGSAVSKAPSKLAVDTARSFSSAHMGLIRESSGSSGGMSSEMAKFNVGRDSPAKTGRVSSQASAKAELSLLGDLLGVGYGGSGAKGDAKMGDDKLFKINLFPNQGFTGGGAKGAGADDDEADYKGSGGGDNGMITLDIDASSGAKTIQSYMADLDLGDDAKGSSSRGGGGGGGGASAAAQSKLGAAGVGDDDDDDDLLALMDSAK